jgi:hypothetical protein
MQGNPLGSWPEVERRSGNDRRVNPDRRMARAGEAENTPYAGPDRRTGERRSGVDRRLQPLFA